MHEREGVRACGVVGWLRIEGEGWMRHCLTEKKKKEEFLKMTKSVGYVTADVIDRRLPYNERGLPYSLNDRRVAYKREG